MSSTSNAGSNVPKRVKLIRPTLSSKKLDNVVQLPAKQLAVETNPKKSVLVQKSPESTVQLISSEIKESVTDQTIINVLHKEPLDQIGSEKNVRSDSDNKFISIEEKFKTIFTEQTLKEIEELKKLESLDGSSKSPPVRRPKLIRPTFSNKRTPDTDKSNSSTPIGSDSPLSKDFEHRKIVYIPNVSKDGDSESPGYKESDKAKSEPTGVILKSSTESSWTKEGEDQELKHVYVTNILKNTELECSSNKLEQEREIHCQPSLLSKDDNEQLEMELKIENEESKVVQTPDLENDLLKIEHISTTSNEKLIDEEDNGLTSYIIKPELERALGIIKDHTENVSNPKELNPADSELNKINQPVISAGLEISDSELLDNVGEDSDESSPICKNSPRDSNIFDESFTNIDNCLITDDNNSQTDHINSEKDKFNIDTEKCSNQIIGRKSVLSVTDKEKEIISTFHTVRKSDTVIILKKSEIVKHEGSIPRNGEDTVSCMANKPSEQCEPKNFDNNLVIDTVNKQLCHTDRMNTNDTAMEYENVETDDDLLVDNEVIPPDVGNVKSVGHQSSDDEYCDIKSSSKDNEHIGINIEEDRRHVEIISEDVEGQNEEIVVESAKEEKDNLVTETGVADLTGQIQNTQIIDMSNQLDGDGVKISDISENPNLEKTHLTVSGTSEDIVVKQTASNEGRKSIPHSDKAKEISGVIIKHNPNLEELENNSDIILERSNEHIQTVSEGTCRPNIEIKSILNTCEIIEKVPVKQNTDSETENTDIIGNRNINSIMIESIADVVNQNTMKEIGNVLNDVKPKTLTIKVSNVCKQSIDNSSKMSDRSNTSAEPRENDVLENKVNDQECTSHNEKIHENFTDPNEQLSSVENTEVCDDITNQIVPESVSEHNDDTQAVKIMNARCVLERISVDSTLTDVSENTSVCANDRVVTTDALKNENSISCDRKEMVSHIMDSELGSCVIQDNVGHDISKVEKWEDSSENKNISSNTTESSEVQLADVGVFQSDGEVPNTSTVTSQLCNTQRTYESNSAIEVPMKKKRGRKKKSLLEVTQKLHHNLNEGETGKEDNVALQSSTTLTVEEKPALRSSLRIASKGISHIIPKSLLKNESPKKKSDSTRSSEVMVDNRNKSPKAVSPGPKKNDTNKPSSDSLEIDCDKINKRQKKMPALIPVKQRKISDIAETANTDVVNYGYKECIVQESISDVKCDKNRTVEPFSITSDKTKAKIKHSISTRLNKIKKQRDSKCEQYEQNAVLCTSGGSDQMDGYNSDMDIMTDVQLQNVTILNPDVFPELSISEHKTEVASSTGTTTKELVTGSKKRKTSIARRRSVDELVSIEEVVGKRGEFQNCSTFIDNQQSDSKSDRDGLTMEVDCTKMKENTKLNLSLQEERVSIKKSSELTDTSISIEPITPNEPDSRFKCAETVSTGNKLIGLENITRSCKVKIPPLKVITSGMGTNMVSTISDSNVVRNMSVDSYPIVEHINKYASSGNKLATIHPVDNVSSLSTIDKVEPPSIKLKINKNVNSSEKNIMFPGAVKYVSRDESAPKLMKALSRQQDEATHNKSCYPPQGTPWSAPDLLRVEKLFKESNITITPVSPSISKDCHSSHNLKLQHELHKQQQVHQQQIYQQSQQQQSEVQQQSIQKQIQQQHELHKQQQHELHKQQQDLLLQQQFKIQRKHEQQQIKIQQQHKPLILHHQQLHNLQHQSQQMQHQISAHNASKLLSCPTNNPSHLSSPAFSPLKKVQQMFSSTPKREGPFSQFSFSPKDGILQRRITPPSMSTSPLPLNTTISICNTPPPFVNSNPAASTSPMSSNSSLNCKQLESPATLFPTLQSSTLSSPTSSNMSSINSINSTDGAEEQVQKIEKPETDAQVIPLPPSIKSIDVKSEIRKKLASSDHRKQQFFSETNDEPATNVSTASQSSEAVLIQDKSTESITEPSESCSEFNTDNNLPLSKSVMIKGKVRGTGRRGRPPKSLVAARNESMIKQLSQTMEHFSDYQTNRDASSYDKNNFKLFGKEQTEPAQKEEESATKETPESSDMNDENPKEGHFMFPIPLFDITESSFENQQNTGFGYENSKSSANSKLQESQRRQSIDGKGKRGRKRKCDVTDVETDQVVDPVQEMAEITRLEEERIKKELEKERKMELRKQRLKERNELAKQKRLRQKMKAEERQKRMKERKLKLQEEKKKLEEEIRNLPTVPVFDDETRMSADNSLTQTTILADSIIEDESCSGATNESQRTTKKSRMEVGELDSNDLTVDQIAEYQWPIQGGELYMIQEQVTNYLGVKSFKRKYPDIKRRAVDSEERAYLVDSGLVSEVLCELGLTAVCSSEILDIMFSDFPEKYEELRKYMREKQAQELSFKQKAWANGLGYKLLMADGTKQDLKKRAMESASNWNVALNKSRKEDRRCSLDLQTYIIHFPRSKIQKISEESSPKIGSYPISVLPGQFCDYYQKYTPDELRYLPLNTVMYGPVKQIDFNSGVCPSSSSDTSSSSSSSGSSTCSSDEEENDNDNSTGNEEEAKNGESLIDVGNIKIEYGVGQGVANGMDQLLHCKVCKGDRSRNRDSVPEDLIWCSKCRSTSHPTCLEITSEMVPHIKSYNWLCTDCKVCVKCANTTDEDKMLFCDLCDRGYHIYCVGLNRVPTGRWHCSECAICDLCGTVEPGVSEDALWFYEFKKTYDGQDQYVRCLCLACARKMKELMDLEELPLPKSASAAAK